MVKKLNLTVGLVMVLFGFVLMVNSVPGAYVPGVDETISFSPGDDSTEGDSSGVDGAMGSIILAMGVFFLAKSRERKRGQAAMEFLMTYGWAILAAIIAIGSLAYFGVFSGVGFPDVGVVNAPFYSSGISIGSQFINLELENNGAEGVTVTSIRIVSDDGGECSLGNPGLSPELPSEDLLGLGPGVGGSGTPCGPGENHPGECESEPPGCGQGTIQISDFACSLGQVCCIESNAPTANFIISDPVNAGSIGIEITLSDGDEDDLNLIFYADSIPTSYDLQSPDYSITHTWSDLEDGSSHNWALNVSDIYASSYYSGSFDVVFGEVFSEPMGIGETKVFDLDCEQFNLVSGDNFKGDIFITYVKGGSGLPLVSTGSISGKVV